MNRTIILLLVVAFQFLAHFHALAWSGGGHMVIAAEAYRLLTPKTRTKVTELLKSHPDYEKWTNSFASDNPNLDLALFVFMQASTWPDVIRRKGNQYDHPLWHYIDYPLRPTASPMLPAPSPTNDILYGISRCEKTLSNTKAPPEERAAYLSWLLHLIGDLHQPLHCSSLFNDVYPKGDKGGNDFYVKPNTKGIKLHSFWDGLLGTSGKPGTHLNYAIEIQSAHPKKSLPELTKAKTPKAWSLESRTAAIEVGYLNGQLQGSTSADTAPDLPEGYTKSAKVVAERRAALAGYRLAAEIQKYVK